MAKNKDKNILLNEITTPQVHFSPSQFDSILPKQRTELSFDEIRTIAQDPLVNLCRHLVASPCLLAGAVVEKTPDCPEEIRQLIEDSILKKYDELIYVGIMNCIDFGFSAFEKIFAYDEKSGHIVLKKLKPLLPDITEILVDIDNGKFNGLRQQNSTFTEAHPEQYIFLELEKSLLLNIDVSGTDWYGTSMMYSAAGPWKAWQEVEKRLKLFLTKISGSRWVVKYPTGSSKDHRGNIVSNSEIAGNLLKSLENNNPVAIPKVLEKQRDSINDSINDAWEIEILADSSNNMTMFLDHQRYYDGKIVESFFLPPRSVLESEYGSRADAQVHTDSSIICMESRLKIIVNQINKHLTNHLIRLNFGDEFVDKCYLKTIPLSDSNLHFLRSVYSLIVNQDPTEQDSISRAVLRERLGIPSENDKEEPTIYEMLKQNFVKKEEKQDEIL